MYCWGWGRGCGLNEKLCHSFPNFFFFLISTILACCSEVLSSFHSCVLFLCVLFSSYVFSPSHLFKHLRLLLLTVAVRIAEFRSHTDYCSLYSQFLCVVTAVTTGRRDKNGLQTVHVYACVCSPPRCMQFFLHSLQCAPTLCM